MDRNKRNEIIELVGPPLATIGYECLEVEWDAPEKALRVFIDNTTGIVMGDCLAANQVLVDLADLDDLISGSYRLEVSSPGIERPLRLAEHFQKVVGEQVNVKLRQKIDGKRLGIGRLTALMDDGTLVLELESGQWHVPISSIESANVVYDWSQV